MALPVNSNISSLNAQRNLQRSTSAYNKTLERLSSGLRINRAGDDAAGLAISEGLRSQIRGLNQAVRNANDGLSLIGTAEGALDSYTEMLQRIRELGVQAANDTNSSKNRDALNQEAQQLLEEMQRIATTVSFNGTALFDGSFTNKNLQVGADANQVISISTGDLRTNQIGQIAHTTSTAVPTTNPLASGDLFINGIDIYPSTSDGVSSTNPTGSALSIATAINSFSAQTGVTAKVEGTTYTATAAMAGGTFDGTTEKLTINGIDVFTGTTVISGNDASGTLRNLINNVSNQTGVTATLDSNNKLVLTAEDGRNVNITTTGSIGDELGLRATDGDVNTTQGGTYTLSSSKAIVIAGANTAYGGLSAGSIAKDVNTSINKISLTTAAGANTAIEQIDNALDQITNDIRARLGAATNRLEQTTSNLQSISENLSASDSRIRDADFAAETASLTKNQILQQAGISILSKANTTTQSVLSLLQNQ